MVRLFLKDNETGRVHEYGTNSHDCLLISKGGRLEYYNLQNCCGTSDRTYSFCLSDGTMPQDYYLLGRVIDIGGDFFAEAFNHERTEDNENEKSRKHKD